MNSAKQASDQALAERDVAMGRVRSNLIALESRLASAEAAVEGIDASLGDRLVAAFREAEDLYPALMAALDKSAEELENLGATCSKLEAELAV
jgi:hypothetical protein